MDIYILLIVLCSLIVFSYIFEVVSRRLKFPSVIILIAFGILIKLFADEIGFSSALLNSVLPVLGTIGLLLIVLEGALELKITHEKKHVLTKAFFSSLVILVVSALALSFLFSAALNIPFTTALVNAIPVSVISSAIAIPSAAHFSEHKKEFIIYESTFSDILGIILFNFAISNEIFDTMAFGALGIEIVLVILASIVLSFIVLLLLQNISHHIKSFLIIAILILLYSAGKMLHISSLILIFFFGLLMCNSEKFTPQFLKKYFNHKKIEEELSLFFLITSESAFLVKTFFFLVFGFSINIFVLGNPGTLSIGFTAIVIIFIIRFIYLKYTSKGSIKPELFVAPRGLITILLFLSIPEKFKVPMLNEGFLLVVILVSLVILAIAKPANDRSKGEVITEYEQSEKAETEK
jgi:NhaP-type Na+/H+ or K+/H+ antiporter